MAYLNVAKLSDALSQMKDHFGCFDRLERVSLKESIGRILFETVYASENIPAFERSMVDGYAVMYEDTLGASEHSPILLEYVGDVDMGADSLIKLERNQAVYVPTGGRIPSNANAMIMVEYTELLNSDVAIYKTAKFAEHIVMVGEDVRCEQKVIEKGTIIKPQHMGMLASLGCSEVKVIQKIRVAVLSTGDELVEVQESPRNGQVRDCNRSIIISTLEGSNCEVVMSEQVKDCAEDFKSAIQRGQECSDLVILSGGSSAGAKDLTEKVLGPNVLIHGLAIKPGKPTIVASINEKPIIGLPGHPAACFITLKALVEPFIFSWVGARLDIKTVPCVSNFQLYAASGRDVYQLVRISECGEGTQLRADILYGKSGMVSALANANAYVVLPMACEGVVVGDLLKAYLL